MITPAVQADAAYQAIRALNHLTYPGRCELVDPADAYDTVAALAAAISVLPQALRQIGDWLAREQAAGRVRVVAGRYAAADDRAIAALRQQLTRAAAALLTAHQATSTAHNLLAELAANGPEL